ncbi:MAG: DUF1800 domain-containing protein [Flavobacterium sp.]|nr:DUF1800 domain-containing protein [Flavobacterium sp.]
MDRRSFLSPKKNSTKAPSTAFVAPTPTTGLNQYTGTFGEDEIIHLLKRTMFGAAKADVAYFLGKTVSQVVDALVNTTAPLPAPPVKEYVHTTALTQPDTNIATGTTWVNDYNIDGTIQSLRRASFKKWWMGVMINQDRSIREKMTLFLHNHFATETADVANGNYCYKHHNLLRTNALGNFKTLTKAITIDPAMLVYLNGQLNTATAPDENYGRELLELFTCGKEPDSQYTEADVKAAAKILTGWRNNASLIESYFTLSRHDVTNKQFSAFFNNTVIQGKNVANGGDLEIDALLNMIFSTQEVAKYICRRLYRWFVYYDIDATVETNIIKPLADIFRNNNYELKPVLSTLLKSEHFFDTLSIGSQIKSPVDLVVGMCREYNVAFQPNTDYVTNYGFYNYLASWCTNMQQNIGDPPDVSGWKAYYQAPQFYEIWINADTLPKRNQFTDTLVVSGYTYNSKKILVDGSEFAKLLPNPSNPNALIDDSLKYLYRINISVSLKAQLKKDILLSGQITDSYWTDAWNLFIATPTNTANTTSVKNKLRDLYKYLMNLPEYQLA